MKNKNNGITLIALIVTIVVLIIIAGVALNIALGENGIFTKAKQAADTYQNAAANEAKELEETYKELQYLTGELERPKEIYSLEGFTKSTFTETNTNEEVTMLTNDTTGDEWIWIPVETPVAESDEDLAAKVASRKISNGSKNNSGKWSAKL